MGGRAEQIAYVQAFRSFIAGIWLRGEGRKVHSFTLLLPVPLLPLLLMVALATASGVGGCC